MIEIRAAVAALLTVTMLTSSAGVAHATPPLMSSAAANVEAAKEAFRQGLELRARGELKPALEKFRQAHIWASTPVTGVELARTHALLGHYLEAREVCLGIARTPVAAAETQRSADARSQAARLAEEARRKLGVLKLKVSGASPGESPLVVVDGAAVPFAGPTTVREVNPGKHEVGARQGSLDARAHVEVAAGESRDVDLPLRESDGKLPPIEVTAEPPTADAPLPPETVAPSSERKLSPLFYAGAGVGGAGLLVGLVTGALALSAKGDLSDACNDGACGPDAYSRLDSARTLATVSTISFLIGFAGAGVCAYGYFVATPKQQRSSVRPWVGVGSAGVSGTF